MEELRAEFNKCQSYLDAGGCACNLPYSKLKKLYERANGNKYKGTNSQLWRDIKTYLGL